MKIYEESRYRFVPKANMYLRKRMPCHAMPCQAMLSSAIKHLNTKKSSDSKTEREIVKENNNNNNNTTEKTSNRIQFKVNGLHTHAHV